MKNIIFATSNKAKLDQINFIVKYLKFPVKIIAGKDIFGDKASYEEIGTNVKDIARNGALDVSKKINMSVITEDTDFCVEYLNGEPGINAGKFLKQHGRIGILKKMKGVSNRSAFINSAVAFSNPKGDCDVFYNSIEGEVSKEEKFKEFPNWIAPINNSFGGGFNAIFIPNGENRTLAEISPQESVPWSYREKNFIDVIEHILKNCST